MNPSTHAAPLPLASASPASGPKRTPGAWARFRRGVPVRRDLATVTGFFLVVAAALRVWAAIWDQGLVWPDEIFQTLEQGHRFAFGRGIIPWEFRDGVRSWVYPGMLGLAMKGLAKLGVSKALTLVQVMKLSMGLLSIVGVWAGVRLAKHLAGPRAGMLASLFGAICPVCVIFGSRCTTETASAALIVLAALLLEVSPTRRRAAIAGALLALTVLFRYQNGIVAAGYLIVLLARKRWSHAGLYLLAAIGVAAIGAVVDWKTWGFPFKPLYAYVKFNLIDKGADRYGTSPFPFFTEHLIASVGLSYSVLLVGLLTATRRVRGVVLVILVFGLVHAAIPHKELRFLVPVIPLGIALASVGLSDLMDGLRRGARPTYVLALLMGGQMLWSLKAPTLGDVGYGSDDQVVWHANEDYFRATILAADQADLCGISYIASARAWTGGYTYLHRWVPVFFDTEPRNLAAANYLVGGSDEKLPAGWQKKQAFGKFALYKKEGGCGPTPADWNLDAL